MKAGDLVQPKGRPNAMPVKVLEIKDLGHGKGYERVKVQLPILGLIRYYALCELQEAMTGG